MKIMIIEDEPLNERHLRDLIGRVIPDAQIVFSSDSVISSIGWLNGGDELPDLIFADIQLSDGLCFDIFERVNLPLPVIFTTAYDNYALKAFDYNALSYILKPVMERDLVKVMKKVTHLSLPSAIENSKKQIIEMNQGKNAWQSWLLLENGDEILPVKVDDICVLESDFREVKVILDDGRSGIINQSLIHLEPSLDPSKFIRVSRKHIIAPSKVSKFKKLGKNKYEALFEVNMECAVEFAFDKFKKILAMYKSTGRELL